MIANPIIATASIILREEQRMIKPLTQTDYRVTKQLFQDVFYMGEDPYFVTAWSSRDKGTSFGYWTHDVLIGAVIVSGPPDGDTCSRLDYIFVHETFRNSGIGTQLLKAVLSLCPHIRLTPVDDPAVKQWYKKHGFHATKPVQCNEVYARYTK